MATRRSGKSSSNEADHGQQDCSGSGAEYALRDIDAVTSAILDQPVVDRTRLLAGGNSRGGILVVTWADGHPDLPSDVGIPWATSSVLSV